MGINSFSLIPSLPLFFRAHISFFYFYNFLFHLYTIAICIKYPSYIQGICTARAKTPRICISIYFPLSIIIIRSTSFIIRSSSNAYFLYFLFSSSSFSSSLSFFLIYFFLRIYSHTVAQESSGSM